MREVRYPTDQERAGDVLKENARISFAKRKEAKACVESVGVGPVLVRSFWLSGIFQSKILARVLTCGLFDSQAQLYGRARVPIVFRHALIGVITINSTIFS